MCIRDVKLYTKIITSNETPIKLKSNGTFLKRFIEEFRNRIVNANSFDDFEDSSIQWIKFILGYNDINDEIFLELIQNHKIGFSGFDRIFLPTWDRM